jgi:hypothetical protein
MEQQGLSQPANGFNFCVIDLWEHRNLLSIVNKRVTIDKLFVLSLPLTKSRVDISE